MCCTRYEGDGFHQLMRTPTLTAWLSVPPPTPVVVTQVDLRRRGVLGGSLKADGGGVARRRGAEHGEGVARRAGERGGDRPAGFSELVLPAETDREVVSFLSLPRPIELPRSAPIAARCELVVCCATSRLSDCAPDSPNAFCVTLEI
jgi:hypothetical protein